jgi:hypothetical protein
MLALRMSEKSMKTPRGQALKGPLLFNAAESIQLPSLRDVAVATVFSTPHPEAFTKVSPSQTGNPVVALSVATAYKSRQLGP